MNCLHVLLALLGFAQSALVPRSPDDRIVGGHPIEITDAPYQVALLWDPFQIGSFQQTCGGTIVSTRTIVTAAHCIDGTIDPQWKIRAGSTYHNQGGTLYNVARRYVHPEYRKSTNDNDIGLVVVVDYLVLSSTTALARLPSQGQSITELTADVTGWGLLSEGGIDPDRLYRVTVPLISQQQCVQAYADFNPVTANMICAGNLSSGGVDACQGDSGGPMMVSGVVMGVTSWGDGCARPGRPGVYTKVSNYRNWIDSNMS